MSTMTATQTVRISMDLPCEHASCEKHVRPLYEQLSVPHYSRGASIMDCPGSLEEWRAEHRTARKRADRAERLGYTFAEVDFSEHADDIFDINTSLVVRQGRPMTDGYKTRGPRRPLSQDQTRCPRHRTYCYGVLQDDRLRAYLTLHRAGDLAMVSMILGHGDHLDAGIMYLLFEGVVEAQAPQAGTLYYNLWRSGQEGLRFYKSRVGFTEGDITWEL